jgi:hypothetical protein
VTIAVTDLIGIYSDPAHVVAFSGSESGKSSPSASGPAGLRPATAQRRVIRAPMDPSEQLDALDIRPSIRLRIDHCYAHHAPYYT